MPGRKAARFMGPEQLSPDPVKRDPLNPDQIVILHYNHNINFLIPLSQSQP